MRSFAFVFGGFLLSAAACNAISGAGDLEICTGSECSRDAGIGSSSGTSGILVDAGVFGGDGSVTREGGGNFDASTCSECPEACENGTCMPWPSCRAGSLKCGTTQNGSIQTSCCESKPVTGGTFDRVDDKDLPATISPYSLDVYDVTVGRFRAFVTAGKGIAGAAPTVGSGAHPKIAGSGWKQGWNAQLSSSTEIFVNALQGGTYTKTPGANESKPVTMVTWFEAYAFCIWDGGRLPTFNEWNYAATGGENRARPWSVPPTNEDIDKSRASYECRFTDPGIDCPPPVCVGADPAQTGACDAAACTAAGGTCQDQPCTGCDVDKDLAPVGQLPAGAGKFGQMDLVGNVAQIVLDARPKAGGTDFVTPCKDCALLMGEQPKGSGPGTSDYQFFWVSADWGDDANEMYTDHYSKSDFRTRQDWLGFRCARDK